MADLTAEKFPAYFLIVSGNRLQHQIHRFLSHLSDRSFRSRLPVSVFQNHNRIRQHMVNRVPACSELFLRQHGIQLLLYHMLRNLPFYLRAGNSNRCRGESFFIRLAPQRNFYAPIFTDPNLGIKLRSHTEPGAAFGSKGQVLHPRLSHNPNLFFFQQISKQFRHSQL